MKQARKQEAARRSRRRKVKGRVAASHVPLLVKIGVRSWKAKRVPVGSRLARLAVLVKVWEIARCDKLDDDGGGGGGGKDVGVSSTVAEEEEVVGEEGVGLVLRDMFLFCGRWSLEREMIGGGEI